ANGKGYPIWVDAPGKMDITAKQFRELSYAGIAAFWIGWPCAIEKCKDKYSIFHTRWVPTIWNNYRFEHLDRFEYTSVEMFRVDVPLGDPLIATLDKYFSHYMFREDETDTEGDNQRQSSSN
ncbi:MAG: hypothetical protein HRU26_16565, partial [Psychroserpens sp.]|nr:hypothetical protein [Psychroserpens sp.]